MKLIKNKLAHAIIGFPTTLISISYILYKLYEKEFISYNLFFILLLTYIIFTFILFFNYAKKGL
jgi:hypothetical protein